MAIAALNSIVTAISEREDGAGIVPFNDAGYGSIQPPPVCPLDYAQLRMTDLSAAAATKEKQEEGGEVHGVRAGEGGHAHAGDTVHELCGSQRDRRGAADNRQGAQGRATPGKVFYTFIIQKGEMKLILS